MKKQSPARLVGFAAAAIILIVTVWLLARPERAAPQSVPAAPAIHAPEAPKPGMPVLPSAQNATETVQASTEVVASDEGRIEQFRDWISRYELTADVAEKARLAAEGDALAKERRDAMARLMEKDPQRALQQAIPYAVRQQLPESITQHLEQRVSGRGTLAVLGILPEPDSTEPMPGIVRTAHLNGQEYRAYVYGRRLSQPTLQDTPLHGIVIGNAIAVHESPLRVLDAAEAAARASEIAPQNARCPVSGKSLSLEEAEAVVEVGGEVRILCNGGHIEVLEGQLLAAAGTGTVSASGSVLDSWSQGPKTLLYIRVRFSDQTSDPQTATDAQTMLSSVDSFFREGSYETTTIASTITPVYTLTNDTAYYNSNGIYTLRSDALAVAKADGYDSVNWNLDAVRYNGGPGAFSGAAYVHSRGCWLKSSSAGVASHEFGHNYGLYHANSWNPTDESPLGPGTWQEYGDSFDTMGAAGAGAYHYNARYKTVLNWIPPDGFLTASNSGIYSIYAHDVITSSNSIRGLRVPRNSSKNYWVEFRQQFTGNTWLMNGAGIRRADNSNNNDPGSELLDMTPNSPEGKNDSALLIGRTFSDLAAGVHITPIGKGGTIPESLNVVVNLGTFLNNNPPSLAINASATAVPAGAAVTFTANAADPDGDSLAYFWDFDDKTYGLNSITVSKSWNTVGEYVVRCVVSDMKGGTASRWIVITVGSPTTFRISGRVTDSNNNPMEGVRVHNGKTGTIYRGCFTDVDGYYTIANLASGSYTVGAAAYGDLFTPSGFVNPVVVSPSKTGINFIGSPKTYRLTGRITDGGVAVPDVQVSDGFRVAASNSNGDYAITNVPNGTYTVTASKPGYSFNPSGWSNPVALADGDVTNRNFATPTYTISGEITGVALTNIVTVTDGYRTTSSSKQGGGSTAKNVYTLTGVPAGSWNIRALFPGASFSPANFSNPFTVSGNTTGKNFALDAVTTYNISGTIACNGAGLAGVTVTAGGRSSLTDNRGGYFIRGVTNGTYDVVPSLIGYGFTPASTILSINSGDVSGQNFAAAVVVTPTIALTVSDAAAAEPGSNTGSFTVTRSGTGTATALTVLYTVNGTATAGADYIALSGSVTIPVGAASANILVTPLDDSEPECPETVVVTLSADSAYVVGSPNNGTITITDNDLATVTVVATDPTASEVGGDTGTVRVTRNGCLNNPLTVNYILGGSATAGSDYQLLPGTLTIPAGASFADITVIPIDDSLVEGDETVVVTLAASAAYLVGAPSSATISIFDNETNHAPQVNAGPDQTVSILGLANLTGSATDDGLPGSGLTYSWTKLSGPGTIAASDPAAKDTTVCFSMVGAYVLRLTVSDGQLSASDDVTVTVTNADPAKVLNAINTGGAAYTNAQGLTYRADTWFSSGNVSSTGTAFAATADGALYQTERSGSFSYNIPVAGGSQNYLVALKFAESVATGPGQRVFDVAVNGILMVNNLDLFSQAGANTAFDLVIPVTTSSDILSIQFQPDAASGLGAKVDAIMVGAAQVLPPAPPANLIANAVSSSEIDLNWADNSANETSFQVEVSTDGTAYTLLASLGANVTGYTHGGLNPSMTYYYRVRACNAAGCSSYAIANGQTQGAPPTAPSNLTLSAAGANQINLAWRDNSSNEDGFVIERSLNGVAFTVIAVTGPNVSTYGAAGLQPNTRYYFRVRAFNSIGSSAYSNTANVRTKAK